MKVITSKRFGYCTDLTDFINENKINKSDIQQITSDDQGDILFYWKDVPITEKRQ